MTDVKIDRYADNSLDDCEFDNSLDDCEFDNSDNLIGYGHHKASPNQMVSIEHSAVDKRWFRIIDVEDDCTPKDGGCCRIVENLDNYVIEATV